MPSNILPTPQVLTVVIDDGDGTPFVLLAGVMTIHQAFAAARESYAEGWTLEHPFDPDTARIVVRDGNGRILASDWLCPSATSDYQRQVDNGMQMLLALIAAAGS